MNRFADYDDEPPTTFQLLGLLLLLVAVIATRPLVIAWDWAVRT